MGYRYRMFDNPEVADETVIYLNSMREKLKNKVQHGYKTEAKIAKQMEEFLNLLKDLSLNKEPNITLGDWVTSGLEDQFIQEVKDLISRATGKLNIETLFTTAHSKEDIKDKEFDDILEGEINAVFQELFQNEGIDFFAGRESGNTLLNIKEIDEVFEETRSKFQDKTSQKVLESLQKITHRDNILGKPQARAQKSDISTKIEISLPTDNTLFKVAELFKGYTFSLKNYNSTSEYGVKATLGNTNPLKAIVGSLTSMQQEQPVAIRAFFAALEVYNRRSKSRAELAGDIFALRFYYELTGAGIRVNDEPVSNVDFLIINNPNGRITVRSTKEIVYKLLTENGKYLSKYDPFREVHVYIQ